MITFADIAMPVYIAIFFLALTGSLFLLSRLARKAWRRWRASLRRVSLRARLRESRRLAWYRLTRPLRRERPLPGPSLLDPDEAITFGKLAGLYKQRGIYADDPQRERRQT